MGRPYQSLMMYVKSRGAVRPLNVRMANTILGALVPIVGDRTPWPTDGGDPGRYGGGRVWSGGEWMMIPSPRSLLRRWHQQPD